MKLAVACIAIFGCNSSGHGADAAQTLAECEAIFETSVARACNVPADCTLVGHDDCCGTTELGVSTSAADAVRAAEATFAPCAAAACGARGCASATKAENGVVPQAGEMIVATCVANRCTSIVQ